MAHPASPKTSSATVLVISTSIITDTIPHSPISVMQGTSPIEDPHDRRMYVLPLILLVMFPHLKKLSAAPGTILQECAPLKNVVFEVSLGHVA